MVVANNNKRKFGSYIGINKLPLTAKFQLSSSIHSFADEKLPNY